ncbi:MAG: PepSY domain-containing protein [Bacteroidetes bacterium]|nr:PepSY domain-containing protein [Bacteroidota bacterium]
MKTTILLFTALLFVAGSAIAGNGSYANNGEEITFIKNNKKLPDQYVQRYFRSSDVWKKFTLKNGKWYVEFDELSGSPHRAFGKPIAINAAGNLQTKALHFLNTELKDYMIAANDIHFVGSTVGEKLNYVNFVQYHKGKEVLFSSLTLRISHNDKVMMFGLDIYKDMDINVNPALSPQDAMSKAVQGLVSKIVNTGYNKELKILPIPEEDGYVHRLVYEVTVHTTNVDRIPGKYYTLIDAHTGEIVYRQNQVLSCTPPQPPPPINIQVQGTLFPTHPYDPFAVIPLPYVKVTTTSSVYTDDQGQLILAGAGPVSATISLEGRWCKVVFDNGTVAPSITTILNSGSNTIDFDSVTDIKHLTAYYHITKVHDYFKAKTGLTVMDIQMIANVDVAGSSCNAYYNGDCNFYAESSTCNSIALVGDVAYHEYGHGINYEAYQAYGANFSSGSLGEGYSDLWAMGITEVPEIGIGFYKMSQNGIRSYSGAPKVYPDDITGQVLEKYKP